MSAKSRDYWVISSKNISTTTIDESSAEQLTSVLSSLPHIQTIDVLSVRS